MNHLGQERFARDISGRSFVCIIGTRPEAIKMAPVIRQLQNSNWAKVHVITTGQQDDLLECALADFDIQPHFSIRHRKSTLTPAVLFSQLIRRLDRLFEDIKPDCVIAQGDTTSVYAASVAAFYRKISFVHVEAGLRTGNLDAPFPEEFHRRAITVSTALHCAPTQMAAENLRREHVPNDRILMSGNTVIDALLEIAALKLPPPNAFPRMKTILMTAHRRENFGAPLKEAFIAIRAFIDLTPDMAVYFPVHPNPNARDVAHEVLSGHPRIKLVEPLGYRDMVSAIQHSWCVVTDSGGLQEEAPALGKPVLVLRDITERPEAVSSGVAEIVGTTREGVFGALSALNGETSKYKSMARSIFPYGDGHAATRIVDELQRRFPPVVSKATSAHSEDAELPAANIIHFYPGLVTA